MYTPTFTHKVHHASEERSWTTLYFKGDDADAQARAVVEEIEKWGPVESPKRTVDFARSHSLSAPDHYKAYVVVLHHEMDRSPRDANGDFPVRITVTIDTNAPDELLAKIVLEDGETWAGHAERAGVRLYDVLTPAPEGWNPDDTTVRT